VPPVAAVSDPQFLGSCGKFCEQLMPATRNTLAGRALPRFEPLRSRIAKSFYPKDFARLQTDFSSNSGLSAGNDYNWVISTAGRLV
jgi:hypothetical protein